MYQTKMNKMNISEEGLALIKKFEGCELEAYQDAVGVWTIGYGHIKDVKEGDKINKDEAHHLLIEEMPNGYLILPLKIEDISEIRADVVAAGPAPSP